MAADSLDALLESIDDAPVVPALCVAMDITSGIPGYGAVRIAQMKLAADDGVRRLVRKYLASGAPIQYGTSIAKSVYGVPVISAMRYAQRIDNDPRAAYGPVAKALGMDEVLSWAMLVARSEQSEVAKAIEEDEFFVQFQGERKRTSRMRDTETGRFTSGGGEAEEGIAPDEDEFFSQVRRRKGLPVQRLGAKEQQQDRREAAQAAVERQEEDALDEELARAEQNQEKLAGTIAQLEGAIAGQQQQQTESERIREAAMQSRAQQAGRLRGLQQFRAATARGREQRKGQAMERIEYESAQKQARLEAVVRVANETLNQQARDSKRGTEELTQKVTTAEELLANLRAAMAQAEVETQRLQDVKEQKRAEVAALDPNAVKVYNHIDPRMSAIDVDPSAGPDGIGYLKGLGKFPVPMVVSQGEGRPPDPARVARLYTGYPLDTIRNASAGEAKAIRQKMITVRSMVGVFEGMHRDLANDRRTRGHWRSGKGNVNESWGPDGRLQLQGPNKQGQLIRYGPRRTLREVIRPVGVPVGGAGFGEAQERNRAMNLIHDVLQEVPDSSSKYYTDRESMFNDMFERQNGIQMPLHYAVTEPGQRVDESSVANLSEQIMGSLNEMMARLGSRGGEEGSEGALFTYVTRNTRSMSFPEALLVVQAIAEDSGDVVMEAKADSAARAYAIYATSRSMSGYSDNYHFLPKHDTLAKIKLAGRDGGGNAHEEELDFWSSELTEGDESTKDYLEDSLQSKLLEFNGGKIESANVMYLVEQSGNSVTIGDAADAATPELAHGSGPLKLRNRDTDPNGGLETLNHMGESPLMPVGFIDQMRPTHEEPASVLNSLRISSDETTPKEVSLIRHYLSDMRPSR